MKKYDQNGGVALVVSDIVLIIALIAALAFGGWAYSSRKDYKENSDKKALAAATKATKAQESKDALAFAEKEKLPNKTFRGPATYGSVTFSYPKTWSGYADQSNSTDPLKSLFYPDIVPSANQGIQYALRVDLVSQPYDQVLRSFEQNIKKGTLKAVAYVPPQMTQIPNVQTGTKLDGEIEQKIQGSMMIIKVRDKTLKVYTESPSFLADYNNTVLNSLTFVP